MLRSIIAISVALACGAAQAQSFVTDNSSSGRTAPRVITGQADLAFWTDLLTADTCDPAVLAKALQDDRSRKACDSDNVPCYRAAGAAVMRACIWGQDITALCQSAYGEPGTPQFEDCMAAKLNADNRPVLSFPEVEAVGTSAGFVDQTLTLIRNGLPSEEDIQNLPGLTLPERRRLLDALNLTSIAATKDCIDAADVVFCEALLRGTELEDMAMTAAAIHGLFVND